MKINCYALDMFFVEVYYDSKNNKIKDVQSFNSGHSLENLEMSEQFGRIKQYVCLIKVKYNM